MSSSSTTWTTDTNTKSGTVQIYSSNVSVLKVIADEGGNAILDLFADQGDDNADKWRMWVNAGDDDLHFSNYTSGSAWTDILTLQDGGNVGIGTDTPDETLHVKGTMEIENILGAHGGLIINKADDNDYDPTIVFQDDAVARWTIAVDRSDSDKLEFNDTVLVLETGGNVGIGTTSPYSPLHIASAAEGAIADGSANIPQVLIEGSGTTTGSYSPTLCLHNSSTGVDNDYIGAIQFTADDSGGTGATPNLGGQYATISARIIDETDGSSSGAMYFDVESNDTSTTAITILGATAGGVNVGIGTTSPAKALHVVNSALVKGRATFTLTGTIDPTGTNVNVPGSGTQFLTELSIGDDIVVSGETRTIATITDATTATVTDAWGSDLVADASPDCNPAAFTVIRDTGAIGMVLDDDGNVGIGTATPDATLHVKGTMEIENILGAHGGLIINKADGSSYDPTIVFYDGTDAAARWTIGCDRNSSALSGVSADDQLYFNDTVLVLQTGGNVGIGTVSPDTKLEVVGSFAANGPSSTFVTFADGDATPSVATGNIFKHHASTQTINMFDGGVCGQIITVISTAAITYDFNASNLKCGSADVVTADGDVTMWVFDGTNWYLLSWMDVSANLADGSAGGF